jgi:hypothetical protein
LGWAFFFLSNCGILTLFLQKLFLDYQKSCDNTEFLSWDGDLRFVSALQLADQIRRLDFISFIHSLLDTPTWPFLRNLFQLLGFFIFGENPSWDYSISLFFWVCVELVLVLAILKFTKTWLGGILAISCGIILFSIPILWTYSFSSMLETQGSFFLLLCALYFAIYSKGLQSFSLLTLSFLLLYLTKYPYGYIFLVTAFCVETIRKPIPSIQLGLDYGRGYVIKSSSFSLQRFELSIFSTSFFLFVKNFFLECFRNLFLRHRYFLLLGLVFLGLYLVLPDPFWVGKLRNYWKYCIAICLVVDFSIFFWKNRVWIRTANPRLYSMVLFMLFPVLFWTFIHPDRFSSSGGTLQHVQMEGHAVGEVVEKNGEYYLYFIHVLYQEIWRYKSVGILLFLSNVFSLGLGTWKWFRYQKWEIYFPMSIILFLHIFILTFLTPNHQSRHVFHLIPLVLLTFVFLLLRFSPNYRKIFGIGVSIFFLYLAQDYYKKDLGTVNLCFSGQGKIYEPPRFFAKVLGEKLQEPSYLWNLIEENHLHRADMELVFAKVSYEKKLRFETNLRKFRKNQKEFSQIISIGRTCTPNEMTPIVEKYHKSEVIASDLGCVEFWKRD